MKFKLTLKKRDEPTVEKDEVSWTLQRQGMAVKGATGTGTVNAEGAFEFEEVQAKGGDTLLLDHPPSPGAQFRGRFVVPRDSEDDPSYVVTPTVEVRLAPHAQGQSNNASSEASPKKMVSIFDIQQNDETDRDWLIWETEGNSDPKYQRGGKERKLGLYRLNYDLLRKDGQTSWQPEHDDGTSGGGAVKIAVLEQLDYDQHKALLKTFLPCYSVEGGRPNEPDKFAFVAKPKTVILSRALTSDRTKNTVDVEPPFIVMPFNYDDNSPKSGAIGKNLGAFEKFDAKRLAATLPRWATASRSTITAFPPAKVDLSPDQDNTWKLRPDEADNQKLPQVEGDVTAKTLMQHQADDANAAAKYYSVKTGVDYVATQSQRVNGKDKLEANSIHAMSRSNIIAGVQKKFGAQTFEAGYQIEILSILLRDGAEWDGIQIREIGGAGEGEVWFPALAIPSHGKAFAETWEPKCDWVDFWTQNFATPAGRAKAEMLAYFGLQHMTSNAQNFLSAFDRAGKGAARRVILRDIGDTILNTCVFDALKSGSTMFASMLEKELADEKHGLVLTPGPPALGGGYANPQITRIGTGIIFFFAPFLKGDLNLEDPAKTAIAGKWGLAHNEGFLAYMREKVGYAEAWSSGGGVDGPEPDNLRTHADLSRTGQTEEYAALTRAVLALPAPVRQRLIGEFKLEIEGVVPQSANDIGKLQELVGAHELLVCAEIHCYLLSDEGKQALRDLHAGKKPRQATGAAVGCPLCSGVKPPTPVKSYACKTCGTWVCASCVPDLKFPRGTIEKMKAMTEERMCCKQGCPGIMDPVKG
ncbi:hypothetical protein [Nannocystis bainbridge]|uniref:Uncharacterized protein n=1 Tax=Nannocystis bainbridge TaxID=2995303 RepID=A0ABT5DRJ0_9BACT|nr:hypothetical protein [Nannocystis bainbridge]MDC0715674.1 hypothetical protein [Nannocystis bainbridge]